MKSQLITGSADYKNIKKKLLFRAFCVSNHLKYKPGILNKKIHYFLTIQQTSKIIG